MDVNKEDFPVPEEFITAERLKKAATYVEEEEGPSRRLTGKMGIVITGIAILMSLVHLYAAIGVVMTQILRGPPRHVRPLPDLPGIPILEAFSAPDPLV